MRRRVHLMDGRRWQLRDVAGRRLHHRLHDPRVPGAAAEVAGEREPYLVLGGRGVTLQQRGRRDEHAGRAEAALYPALLQELGLQGTEIFGTREALDGRDLLPDGLHREV